nr:MAG TPA: hypothetical protein [Caudoviricetes sp.]
MHNVLPILFQILYLHSACKVNFQFSVTLTVFTFRGRLCSFN